MSKIFRIILTLLIVFSLMGWSFRLLFWSGQPQPQPEPEKEKKPDSQPPIKQNLDMKIISPQFNNRESIPAKYTCDGENVSPPLEISQVPEEAVSLALIVDDPDAPSGEWVHWLVWNISPETKEIKENSLPAEAQEGTTDFGEIGYGGPCPPSGTHRYFFKLFALDTTLDLDNSTNKPDLEKAMEGHILEKAELVGRYQR